jgi:hypothetical protein
MPLTTLLRRPLQVISLGLEIFAEELERDGVTVVHVDWRPPVADVAALLARVDDSDQDADAPR